MGLFLNFENFGKIEIKLAGAHKAIFAALRDFSQSNKFILSEVNSPKDDTPFIRLTLFAFPENLRCGTLEIMELPYENSLLILNPRPYPNRQKEPTARELEYYTHFCELALQRLVELGFLEIPEPPNENQRSFGFVK